MNWALLNIPLCAVFFLAVTGIPFWLVIRHPDHNPIRAEAAGQSASACAPTLVTAR